MRDLGEPTLPEPTRAWCLAQRAGAARIESVTRLHGGLSAQSHRLDVRMADGAIEQWVLRRNSQPGMDAALRVMALVLESISSAGCRVPTPKLVGCDPDAEACDAPAILMTCLRGEPNIAPRDIDAKVPSLARALAEFHRVRPAAPSELRCFEIDFERRHKPVPEGIMTPDWAAAYDALAALRYGDAQLIHHDFHIGNALFDGGHVTGIVDFETPKLGPWQFDVTYCRMDLSMVFGLDAADLFVESYEAARGERIERLPLWDLAGAVRAFPDPEMWLPGWLDLGRTDLGPELIRERLAVFVDRALVRNTL